MENGDGGWRGRGQEEPTVKENNTNNITVLPTSLGHVVLYLSLYIHSSQKCCIVRTKDFISIYPGRKHLMCYFYFSWKEAETLVEIR